MFRMNPLTLLDLLSQPEFLTGLAVGAVSLAAVLLVPRLGWFMAWGAAALAGLAWMGFLGMPSVPWWGFPAALVTAVGASVGAHRLPRHGPRWMPPALFALWVLGVWGTVPDTERAAVAMGVTAALLPALWFGARVRVEWPGAFLAAGVLAFVAVTDGAARPTSIVGALGGVGMLVVAPAVLAVTDAIRRLPTAWVIAAQVLHVIVSGRVAGRMRIPEALIVVLLSAAAAAGALCWSGRRSGR